MDNAEVPVQPVCLFLDCGGKLEEPDRRCSLQGEHRESREARHTVFWLAMCPFFQRKISFSMSHLLVMLTTCVHLNPESDLPAGLERPECQWCVKYRSGILAQGNQEGIELQTLPEEALTDERWRPLGVWPPWVTASNRTDPLQASAALLYITVCVVKASVQIIAVNVLSASFWMGGCQDTFKATWPNT